MWLQQIKRQILSILLLMLAGIALLIALAAPAGVEGYSIFPYSSRQKNSIQKAQERVQSDAANVLLKAREETTDLSKVVHLTEDQSTTEQTTTSTTTTTEAHKKSQTAG